MCFSANDGVLCKRWWTTENNDRKIRKSPQFFAMVTGAKQMVVVRAASQPASRLPSLLALRQSSAPVLDRDRAICVFAVFASPSLRTPSLSHASCCLPKDSKLNAHHFLF